MGEEGLRAKVWDTTVPQQDGWVGGFTPNFRRDLADHEVSLKANGA